MIYLTAFAFLIAAISAYIATIILENNMQLEKAIAKERKLRYDAEDRYNRFRERLT